MESPWSTPTQSEIGEAEAALNAKGANDLLFDGLDSSFRELGDGEPSFDAAVDSDFMASTNNNYDDEELSQRSNSRAARRKDKKSPRGASKSPEKRSPTKGTRKVKKSTKLDPNGEEEDTGSKSRKGSPTKRRSNSRQPPSNAGSDVANTEELESPTKTRRSPRKKRSQVKKKDMSNGDSDEGVSSATTTTRTLSTAATDLTSSSGVSSHTPVADAVPSPSGAEALEELGSPTKETASPTRSPIKSPRKGQRSKARDVISLPKPYNTLKSDQIKRWNKEMLDGKVVGADNEAELELFKSICFTNALVLKINQLAKQGLMDKKTLYSFAMQIARFKIPPHENTKCQQSFFRFARELTAVRINMSNPEQQVQFDEETASWIPPIYPKPKRLPPSNTRAARAPSPKPEPEPEPPLQPEVFEHRPPTAKPKDPDSYDFKDPEVAKDYRKMWEKYHEMEQMLMARTQPPPGEAEEEAGEEDED